MAEHAENTDTRPNIACPKCYSLGVVSADGKEKVLCDWCNGERWIPRERWGEYYKTFRPDNVTAEDTEEALAQQRSENRNALNIERTHKALLKRREAEKKEQP